ncbi:MAG: formamidopyrimidine-DNA glycosylase [Gemmatimonadaceae bacterium]|nr:formamidopyrimidine-DNA glycosylase [Gemmatimonadaceae bacterium]
MPEYPDIAVYRERLEAYIVGHVLQGVRVLNPFVLRTVRPDVLVLANSRVVGIRAIGKRLVVACDHDCFVVIHLMIAGRLRWRPPGKSLPGKLAVFAFDFAHGTLFLSEAGSKRRASVHVVEGEASLVGFDRGGIDPMQASAADYAEALRRENHTLKRSLTDPRLFSGIGNAYSDELLHAARLSPLQLTGKLTDDEIARIREATRATLTAWTSRLRLEVGDAFPETVTAFHDGMAVHGRFGQPCPDCHAPVQRIRYADNETNYCARCQTGGRILADRALSRLLKKDFPRRLEDLEG